MPDKIPINNENERENRIKGNETETLNSIPRNELAAPETINARLRPIIAPTIPPTRPKNAASNKKMDKMSLFLAPIAFITPISLLLSRTEVNIVLAIPIPPIKSEMDAIPVINILITPKIVFIVSTL